jgi:hypothetical protein
VDLGFAAGLGAGVELAEAAEDVVGFEVDAFDLVVFAAAFDGGPLDDVISGGAEWVAHVGLLIDFVGAGAGLALGDELIGSEVGVLGAIDDVKESELDGIGHGDFEIQIPGAGGRAEYWSVGVLESWKGYFTLAIFDF